MRVALTFGALLRPFIAALLLFAFASEREALAFCRSTNCKCSSDKQLPDGPTGLPRSTCSEPDGDCPRDEHNCRKTGAPLAWAGGCVGYSPNLAGTTQLTADEWNEAFQQAFTAWALADCGDGKHPSIQLDALRPTTCAASEYNPSGPNVNTIYFTDNGWGGAQTTANLDGVLARTKTNFDPVTGEIWDADIAINSARHDFTVTDHPRRPSATYPGDQDLVSVLTHEAGHFLGLDHSDVGEAVMYWQYGAGDVNRKLHPDDIAAICTVYPPDREATCDSTPRGGLEDTCGAKPKVKAGCSVAPSNSGTFLTIGFGFLGLATLRAKTKRGRTRL